MKVNGEGDEGEKGEVFGKTPSRGKEVMCMEMEANRYGYAGIAMYCGPLPPPANIRNEYLKMCHSKDN